MLISFILFENYSVYIFLTVRPNGLARVIQSETDRKPSYHVEATTCLSPP